MYYEELKASTKKAKNFIDNYNRATASELRQVYGSFSTKKNNIYNDIKKDVTALGFSGLKITTYNKNYFTCCAKKGNQLLYITPSSNYLINL